DEVTAVTTDVDPYSRWTTGGPQQEGQGLVVDLRAPVAATALELGLGAYAVDYPERLVVEARVGDSWQVVHDGRTTAAALRATVAMPTDPRIVVPLLPSRASTFRITTRAGNPKYHWSVSSLVLVEAPSGDRH
ncbi:MAG TPA: hypothetical protein VMF13_16265, partial [Luteitalea sp.]|nr:hypothetical protein [Luteitalea sp.]